MLVAFSVATIVEPEILIVDEILSVGDEFPEKVENKMRSLISEYNSSLCIAFYESIKVCVIKWFVANGKWQF